MENFESFLTQVEKSLNNIRVSLIKKISKKIKELEKLQTKKIFGKIKT